MNHGDSQHSNEVMLKAKSEAYAEITKCVNAVGHSERNEKAIKEKWQAEKSRVKAMQTDYDTKEFTKLVLAASVPLKKIAVSIFLYGV